METQTVDVEWSIHNETRDDKMAPRPQNVLPLVWTYYWMVVGGAALCLLLALTVILRRVSQGLTIIYKELERNRLLRNKPGNVYTLSPEGKVVDAQAQSFRRQQEQTGDQPNNGNQTTDPVTNQSPTTFADIIAEKASKMRGLSNRQGFVDMATQRVCDVIPDDSEYLAPCQTSIKTEQYDQEVYECIPGEHFTTV